LTPFTPDSTRIVFDRYVDGDTHLFVINTDGSGETQLSDGFCDEMAPAWSTEGPTLAFERNCGGTLGIIVGDFSRVVRVTAPQHGFDLYPAWRPLATVAPTTAKPIGPVSTASGDARLVGAYFQWETQVTEIDFLPDSNVRTEHKIQTDDLSAAAVLSKAQPETDKGKTLQRTATKAFRLDAAAANNFVRSYQAAARGRRKAAAKYQRAGETLARQAQRKFDTADNLAELPY
jgi:hypothetical protein